MRSQALSLPTFKTEDITVINRLCYIVYQLFSHKLLPAALTLNLKPLLSSTKKTCFELHWNHFPLYLYFEGDLAEKIPDE